MGGLVGFGPNQKLIEVGVCAPFYSNTTIPAGNTIANTAAETPFASTIAIPANTLRPGDVLNIRTWGVLSVGAVVPTLQGRVKLASSSATVILLDTGAVGGLTTGTDLFWTSDVSLLIQSIGASAKMEAAGLLNFQSGATAVLAVSAKNTAPLTFDSTVLQTISYAATWNMASASNSIQIRQMTVK